MDLHIRDVQAATEVVPLILNDQEVTKVVLLIREDQIEADLLNPNIQEVIVVVLVVLEAIIVAHQLHGVQKVIEAVLQIQGIQEVIAVEVVHHILEDQAANIVAPEVLAIQEATVAVILAQILIKFHFTPFKLYSPFNFEINKQTKVVRQD